MKRKSGIYRIICTANGKVYVGSGVSVRGRIIEMANTEIICLITPPSGFLLDERVFVSLGILKVAAVLEQHHYVVEHLDLSGVENWREVVTAHASRSQATIFGLTATTPQLPSAAEVAGIVRGIKPDARLILGGPHVTLTYAAARREKKLGISSRGIKAVEELKKHFDVLTIGDGEDAILEALKPDAPAVIDADDPKGPLFLTNKRLEQLPLPARHLADMHSYHYTIDGEKATSLIAQLGCPYACRFCGGRESAMLRRVRLRGTEGVLKEVLSLHETYGYRGFMFYDDELNVNKQMVGLMNALANLKLDLRLRGYVKAELFNDEQAEALVRAGFRWLLTGFESGSPRILENINKKATREDNTNCLRIAHKHGLKVKALMSLGHAGETKETIESTKDWLLSEQPDDFDVTVITTYPGTPYYDHATESKPGVWTYRTPNGDQLHAYDADFLHESAYYKGVPGEYRSFVFTDYLSSEDLVGLRDNLESEVREGLGIPFNPASPALRYDASVGQLPGTVLRRVNG